MTTHLFQFSSQSLHLPFRVCQLLLHGFQPLAHQVVVPREMLAVVSIAVLPVVFYATVTRKQGHLARMELVGLLVLPANLSLATLGTRDERFRTRLKVIVQIYKRVILAAVRTRHHPVLARVPVIHHLPAFHKCVASSILTRSCHKPTELIQVFLEVLNGSNPGAVVLSSAFPRLLAIAGALHVVSTSHLEL
eukprot:CAMPEP_0167775986 /NCGR_PEP_ID=MMETSP0111_2-20121227/2870_1 /TAXON_ID=91324 /ORGANISM="Lotharella globosa, Strain CCCM811" /LENGTH=191 /DNA_ID=CAMNT_0007665975 /DNA_START=114 /DNA_END=689 /DNA_ORIENTATION=-